MDMKIGRTIAQLRRQKGFTQEHLAQMIGVSAPAVSKWETDSSYPDITLLCPLARALDTTVDELLRFEKQISADEIHTHIQSIIEIARSDGCAVAEEQLTRWLREYPNSIALKFNAALVYDTFYLIEPNTEEDVQHTWQNTKKDLLTQVHISGDSAYSPIAALQLAALALNEEDISAAERLLGELPQQNVDATIIRMRLSLQKGESMEALKTVQRSLFAAVRLVQSCLIAMLEPELALDDQQALELCQIYKEIDVLFGLGGMADGLLLEVSLRKNDTEDAACYLARYVDALTQPLSPPKRMLFSPGLTLPEIPSASSREMRQTLLKSLNENQYKELLQRPIAQAALQKLKESLE